MKILLLGDYQFARNKDWEAKGLLGLLGMGIDPGVSEIFVKYAENHLFDEIDEIGIRDGSNMTVKLERFIFTRLRTMKSV